jgi:hypothetical protein
MPLFQTPNDDGSTSHRDIFGRRFSVPKYPSSDPHSAYAILVNLALEAYETLADATHSVTTDPTLSKVGRDRKLRPVHDAALRRFSTLRAQMNAQAKVLEESEQRLFAVPGLNPTHAAVAIEDAEIRRWWSAGEPKQRENVLKNPGDVRNERVMMALLRSPIPAASDAELRVVNDCWMAAKRHGSPDAAARIDDDRMALEWGQEQLSLLASMAMQLIMTHGSYTDRNGLLEAILTSPDEGAHSGYGVFGFSTEQAAFMQRRLARERVK